MAQSNLRAESGEQVLQEPLFDDAELRITRLTVQPGATYRPTEVSDHWLCILQGARVLASGDGSTAWELSYSRGQSAFLRDDGSAPRAFTNRGEATLRFLRIDLKR
jgi:hypothetical protein